MILRKTEKRIDLEKGSVYKLGIMSDTHFGRTDTDLDRITWELEQSDGVILNGDILNLIINQDPRYTHGAGLSPAITRSTHILILR